MKRGRRRRSLGWLAALAASGCLTPPWARDRGPCPVGLVATDDLPRELRLRSRMRVDYDQRELHLETIAERVPGGIVLVGLAPFGIRLFAVRQRGREVEVESPSPALEKVGLWTLDALHRAYWIEPPEPPAAGDPSEWIREDERVSEWRQQGRLLRREFASTDERVHTVVSIDYAADDGNASRRGTRIRNPWCGYEALLTTPEPSVLEPGASSAGRGPAPEGEGPP